MGRAKGMSSLTRVIRYTTGTKDFAKSVNQVDQGNALRAPSRTARVRHSECCHRAFAAAPIFVHWRVGPNALEAELIGRIARRSDCHRQSNTQVIPNPGGPSRARRSGGNA